jgi:hypothetical protein
MKLAVFFQIFFTTGSKVLPDSWEVRKGTSTTKPYKGPGQKKPEWFVFWQPILG